MNGLYNNQPIQPSYGVPQPTVAAPYQQPFGMMRNQPNLQTQPAQLTGVNGFESVKMFQTVPNARYALFDTNEDYLYVKSTDASNYPSYEKYKLTRVPLEGDATNSDQFVSLEAFAALTTQVNELKEELTNAQQLISKLQSNKSKWNSNKSGNGQPDTTG